MNQTLAGASLHSHGSILAFLRRHAILLFIVALAAFFRLSDLGRQSYWFDEAGVAVAASQPSPMQALEIAREHVAVPPLDYLVAWCMGRFSLQEGWLRLPAALWGTASVGLVYLFTVQLLGPWAAAVSGLLLAISPAQIFLSQELRAYSAWFFFYWLTTLFLYQAIQAPTPRRWIKVIIAAVLGSYFHFFTLLAWFNGLAFLFAAWSSYQPRPLPIRGFLAVSGVIGLLVMPGFLVFGSEPFIGYPQEWLQLVPQIFTSLGWFPLFNEGIGYILGFFLLLLACTGVTYAVSLRHMNLISLVVSAVFQIVLITMSTVVKGYFFAWRQYFVLLPFTFLFAAYALHNLVLQSTPLFTKKSVPTFNLRPVNRALAIILLLGLVASSLIEIQVDRTYLKSNARQVTTLLQQTWQPGDQVWTIPWYEPLLFNFYLEDIFADTRFSDKITGYKFENLPDPASYPGNTFLITSSLSSPDISFLFARGFQPTTLNSGPHWVWVHSP